MDVAFVSEFAGTSWSSARWRGMRSPSAGEKGKASHSMSPTASGCSTVVSPNVVPDARSEDSTKDLWVTSEANIGSYAAVPVMLSDGRPYGTLCCVSHKVDPGLKGARLGAHGGVARELSRQIQRKIPIVRSL